MSQSGSVPPVGRQQRCQGDADVIDFDFDFEIKGQKMQFVEIELDPSESTTAEAGAMMFKDVTIHIDTIFGDGSKRQSGTLGSRMGAGRRLLSGEVCS
jgi:uncharacterized protein (AIM24 family)